MRTGMMALALGLMALRFLPVLPPVWLWLLMPVAGLMLLPFRTYPAAFFLFGLSWACAHAQWALDDRLPPELDGETRWLEGRVTGLPQNAEGVVRFELSDSQSRRSDLPRHLRLAWYDGPPVNSGERWRLAVKLKRPVGLLNPHAFDYETWLLAQRIGATGTVKAGERLAPARWALRDGVRQRLQAVDAQGRTGVLTALVLGDGAGLSREDWQVLQDTSTVHLLVISGQHVGLLAGLVYLLIAGLARYGLWPGRLPWLPWACGLAFVAALGYGLLAGFEVPVRRACLMIGLVLLWRLRFRHLGAWWPLLLALNGVLLMDPLASLQPGFWLSFAALLSFCWSWDCRSASAGRWSICWRCPGSVWWCCPRPCSGPCCCRCPTSASGYCGWLAGGLVDWLFAGLALVAGKVPAWLPAAIPLWVWGLGTLGAFLLLLPRGVPMRPLGWPLLLLLVFPPRPQLPNGIAEVWQLDVGQGLAIMVRTRHHTLLYDAGPRFRDLDQGARVVLPALRKLGVKELDLMLISHAHADHAGGARAVANGLPVKRVLSGEPADLPAGLQAEGCESGRQWTWDGVSFKLWHWPQARDSNQNSCVLQIEAMASACCSAATSTAAPSARCSTARWPCPPIGCRPRTTAVAVRRRWRCSTSCSPRRC